MEKIYFAQFWLSNIQKTKQLSKKSILFLICLLFAFPIFSFSQQKEYKIKYQGKEIIISKKVVSHFGEERVSKSISEGKEDMVYWDFYVKNAYELLASMDEKSSEAKSIADFKYNNKFQSKMGAVTKSNFNILDFDIKLNEEPWALKLDDNTMVVIKSKEQFNKEFNKYLTSLK